MPNGYGQVTRERKVWLAHRWAAHVAHGPCPPGQVTRHTCDNRSCIEPEHLIYGTQGQNLDDRKERHRYRKLTRADAESIKELAKTKLHTFAAIARKFGVSSTMISHIINGRQWA